jgi:hypothetical protein
MSRRTGLTLLAVLLAGCGKVPEAAPSPQTLPPPEVPPVLEARAERVPVIPVETRPFEEGYEAGYAKGLGAGKVGAKMPPGRSAGSGASWKAISTDFGKL